MKMRQLSRAAAGALVLGGLTLLGSVPDSALAQGAPSKERGRTVYTYWCAPCHASGPGHPGTQGLQIKYRDGSVPAVLEERADLVPVFVKTIVRTGILSMPPFRKTEVTDAQLDDIAAYLAK